MSRRIDVIATTISGSVSDWGKIKHIVPLFAQHGEDNVALSTLDSHAAARRRTAELLQAGNELLSLRGSGILGAVF